MKTLGLLAGMSWESTIPYYRLINQTVREKLGGLHSAKLVLHNVDFHEIAELQRTNQWHAAGEQLGIAARGLANAGAQAIVICTNTMHIVAQQVCDISGLPLLHIGDATGEAIATVGLNPVGFIGTRFSMEKPFLHDYLRERYRIDMLTPDENDRALVHHIIFDELCQGQMLPQSRAELRRVMGRLIHMGAQAIVLGCTELSLLVEASDATVPMFDTTTLHARYAAMWSMNEEGAA
jgi:aspartate racemase